MPRIMSKKYYIIYETKNLKNGKIYIGMHETDNLEDGYLGSGKRLKRAIRYYGREFFERRVLYTLSNQEEMITKEVELVTEEFIKRKDTYNLKVGGKGGFISEEHKNKFINSNGPLKFAEKLKNDKDFFKKHSKISSERLKKTHASGKIKYNTFTGKQHTEETKQKMSQKASERTGDKNSQFGSCWITNDIENRKIKKNEQIPDGWKLGRKIK